MNPIYRLNPSLEALKYEDTLGVFAGDRTITLRGTDSLKLFERLQELFVVPRTAQDLQKLDEAIYEMLPRLIETCFLVEDRVPSAALHGSGPVMEQLKKVFTSATAQKEPAYLICIPDDKGLSVQKEALSQLKPGQALIAGIRRGSSVFILPPIYSSQDNMVQLFFRLLSTEPGVANSYLAQELLNDSAPEKTKSTISDAAASWIAADIMMLVKNNKFNKHIARIYRGTESVREDVTLTESSSDIKLEDTVEDKVSVLSKLVVGNGKLVGRYHQYVFGDAQYPIYMTYANVARVRVATANERDSYGAWGSGQSPEYSLLTAFMEGVERYSIEDYDLKDHPLCSRNSLDKPVLDRLAVTGYGKGDDILPDLPADAPRRWHTVKGLKDGKEYLVPLEQACYPLNAQEVGYQFVDMSTSSGVASHFSEMEAIKSACHELIERDAFLIAWLRGASPPLIELDSLPENIRNEVRFIESKGWEVRFIDLTTDLAPAISALVITPGGELFRYGMGAASHDDVGTACLKALREACVPLYFPRGKPRPPQEVLDKLNEPTDHVELYATGAYDDLILKLFGSDERRHFNDVRRFNGYIAERLQKKFDVYIADLTTKRVKSLLPSVSVMRVIVPELVPLYFGKHWPRTGSRRIRTVPEATGWKVDPANKENYQRFPHPFP
ncbi:MAG: YcaO-like family protein [Alphaproteobacteria bacterium]